MLHTLLVLAEGAAEAPAKNASGSGIEPLFLILGFVFLPLTTLVYAWMVNSGIPVVGINILYLLVAALLDLGSMGGGYRTHRARI